MQGKVKWYNFKKGYGFIEGEDGEEYFVHYSALEGIRRLNENEAVSFETKETDKGKQAVNVKPGSASAGKGKKAAPAKEEPEADETAEEPEEDESFGDEEPEDDELTEDEDEKE